MSVKLFKCFIQEKYIYGGSKMLVEVWASVAIIWLSSISSIFGANTEDLSTHNRAWQLQLY